MSMKEDKDTRAVRKKEQILRQQNQHQSIACEVCLKEIPTAHAHSVESEEYVKYFCGLECYDKWGRKKNHSMGNKKIINKV